MIFVGPPQFRIFYDYMISRPTQPHLHNNPLPGSAEHLFPLPHINRNTPTQANPSVFARLGKITLAGWFWLPWLPFILSALTGVFPYQNRVAKQKISAQTKVAKCKLGPVNNSQPCAPEDMPQGRPQPMFFSPVVTLKCSGDLNKMKVADPCPAAVENGGSAL